MLWLDHLRSNADALQNFRAFLIEQKMEAYSHFENATTVDGLQKVKGRIEAIKGLEIILDAPEREQRDVAERLAQRARAESGVRLAH